uniref:SCP domain-containing protein n=1 Tax=Elaeophora elaphi TaxID=1147741 RepID=A0A0R3RN36_9BILA
MKYFLFLWTSYSYFIPTNTGNSASNEAIISASEPNYHILGRQIRVREKRSVPYYHLPANSYPNMLIYSEPLNKHMREVITEEHNRLRRIIPATDMQQMYWSDELAMSAQRHANRHSSDRINVGENIWAAPYSNYTEAVSRWFNEVYDSRCDCKHVYKHCCGHYVQIRNRRRDEVSTERIDGQRALSGWIKDLDKDHIIIILGIAAIFACNV